MDIGGKPVIMRGADNSVAERDAIAFCDNQEEFIGTLRRDEKTGGCHFPIFMFRVMKNRFQANPLGP